MQKLSSILVKEPIFSILHSHFLKTHILDYLLRERENLVRQKMRENNNKIMIYNATIYIYTITTSDKEYFYKAKKRSTQVSRTTKSQLSSLVVQHQELNRHGQSNDRPINILVT